MSGPSPAAFGIAPPNRWEEFTEGMWRRNPVFVMVLGMCPTLAVTVSAINSISMGLATTSCWRPHASWFRSCAA